MAFSAIVAKIEGAEKTFVGWIVKEYAALYEKEPAIEQVVDTTIDYVEPALVIVLDATGGAAIAPEVASVITEAQSDLKVVSALIYDFGPTPQAASIIAGVKTELQALQAAGHIKDAATQAKFTLIVNAVATLATAIANAVASAEGSAPAPAAKA
jgi:hypothetical protein